MMTSGSILIAEHLRVYKPEDIHKCELHINLWKQSQRLYYLDFGLKLLNFNDTTDAIRIYFPFSFHQANVIKDLGECLTADNGRLANIIFNENFIYTAGSGNSLYRFECRSKDIEIAKRKSFWLYKLGRNEISVETNIGLEGTFVKLSLSNAHLPNNEKDGNLYIRFRISIDSADAINFLKRDEELSNDVIQAAFSKVELYDIRVNDRRESDEKVLAEMEKCHTLLNFMKAHFFFVTRISERVCNVNFERMDARLLETKKWGKYIDGFEDRSLIAYKWNKRACPSFDRTVLRPFEGLEIFFKNICDDRSPRKILLYFLLAICIGAIGSLLVSFHSWGEFVSKLANLLPILLLIGVLYCQKDNR